MRAIDTCCFVFPTKEILRYMVYAWGHFEGYLDLFGRNIVKAVGYSVEEYEKLKKTMSLDELRDYMANLIEKFAIPLNSFVKMLDDAGIEKANHINEDVETTTGVKPLSNDYIASIVKEYPDKLTAFAGIDPHKGEKAVKEVERAITKLELSGITLYPFKHRLHPNDPKYYPIYEKCIELDVPVWIHTSNNWDFTVSADYGHPKYLDKLAAKYPDLKIIAGHAGWPWVNEMVIVAWRHKNIYIELSAFRPKHIVNPGSGFEPLLYYGDRTIRNKVVWGSTWILLGMPPKNVLDEMKQLPVRKESLDKWLYENAKKLFK